MNRARVNDGLAVSLRVLAALCISGCGAPAPESPAFPTEPITRLIGEIHLHQFAHGAHGWAAFLPAPVDAASVHDDQIIELDTETTLADGPCALHLKPACDPLCDGDHYCSGTQRCSPIPVVAYVDGGPIEVTGSHTVPLIRLHFGSPESGYDSDPPPGALPLFAGGETLQVSGGIGATRLIGTLNAPNPVQLISPDPTGQLHLPNSAFPVRWKPENAAVMVLTVNVSRGDGDYAWIRCVTGDGGSIDVPGSLMSRLPAAPRSVRVELERDDERVFKTATPGVGMLAHAAWSEWMNGDE